MIRIGIKYFSLIFVIGLAVLLAVQASADDSFTDQELDELLAPIALYPDPLLAQMLPASTYPAEIAEANAWLKSGGTLALIDQQPWDESVKAIVHYSSILQIMADRIDWTADLGEAFLYQPESVTRSIQRLRWQAREASNLESTPQQTVVTHEGYIEIIPAQPQYLYVPQYDPSVIYIQRWTPGRAPFMTFDLGLIIGDWLNMDVDWGHHHVIYHGWHRPGWVNHARPYVHVRNVYINRSRPYIHPTWRHDASRGASARYRTAHPGPASGIDRQSQMIEIKRRTVIQPKPATGIFGPRGNTPSFSSRGRESRGLVSPPPTKPVPNAVMQPSLPAQPIGKQPAPPVPTVRKETPPARPAHERMPPGRTPSENFGGYRGSDEAKAQSLRGQASRHGGEATKPTVAPERKGRGPTGKDDARGKSHR